MLVANHYSRWSLLGTHNEDKIAETRSNLKNCPQTTALCPSNMYLNAGSNKNCQTMKQTTAFLWREGKT